MSENAFVIIDQPYDGCCRLTLNRPESCNALNGALLRELQVALRSCEDNDVAVVWLAGVGRHFCAGLDLKELRQEGRSEASVRADGELLVTVLARWRDMKAVTVLSHQGACMGGGCGFLASADIAISAEDAFLRLPELEHGLIPAIIGPALISSLGLRRALHLTLVRAQVSAEQAERYGLIHEVVPAGTVLDSYVAERVQKLLAVDPAALLRAKRLFSQHAKGEVDLSQIGPGLL